MSTDYLLDVAAIAYAQDGLTIEEFEELVAHVLRGGTFFWETRDRPEGSPFARITGIARRDDALAA